MVITVADARTSDGLRPIDMARDVPQIIELLKLVFGEALELDDQQLLGDEVGASLSSLFYRLNPVTSRLANGFVWLADGRIVGNVTLLPTKAWDRFLVANVAVHPNYRRRGIARAMMHAVTSAVKTRGGRTILLQVVKDNDPAIDLYRSLGYVGLGHLSTWYSSPSRLRRLDPPGNDTLTIGDVLIDVAGHAVTRDGTPIPLTPLEFDLLVELARKPRQVFTREVLLEHVWGYRHSADTRLVNVHVQRLRAKIEKDPENPEVVLTVRGVGYKAGPVS